MKNKAKFFLSSLILLLLAYNARAQTPKMGLYAGFNSANVNFRSDFVSLTGSSMLGIQLGAALEYPVSEQISVLVLPGFVGKGTDVLDSKVRFTYLNVPGYLTYNYGVGPGKAFGGAGLYLGFALSGKIDGEKINFSEDEFNRLDYGASIIAGYELAEPSLKFMLTVSPGIANLSQDPDIEWKNTSFGVGVAYMLRR